MARNTFRQGNSNTWQGIQMARNQYVQHILLNISNISSVSDKRHTAATVCIRGSSSTHHGGQLATWSTRCVVISP
ncbi:hypothetical protein T03_4167 [Trichinella britovi]|uniref:Uncharacterized protein n=1 Tax=Trichinella britovi TaxID=45882 RepID=A0A0V1D0X6_TRIBR|nr:hypothetical protein T03_4167 [Trichinella britovi]